MDQVLQSTPEIIEQAAKSPLGIFALMIIALSILGFFFFRTSSERTRIAMFVLMFIGVASFGIATLRSSSQTLSPSEVPRSTDTPQKAADVGGNWKAKVTYSWGATYEELFTFNIAKEELSGTASYLRVPRGISEGIVQGDRISFVVPLEELLGDETKKYSNRYTGVISGSEIRFTMQDSKGTPPIQFLATR